MKSRNPRRGGILGGLLISALIIVCLMIAGGLFVARHIRIQTTERNGGDDVSIDTPGGHLSIHAHDNAGAATDLPVYPGAHRKSDSSGNAVVEWTSNHEHGTDDGGFSVSASEMITTDSLDKVVNYYRGQLPNWVIVNEKHGAVRLELREGGYKRIIAISEHKDGTHIGVASLGGAASN
jgi:hypothetical protein